VGGVKTTPIVALDFPTQSDALALVARLDGLCDFFKVGLELFTSEGPTSRTRSPARFGLRVDWALGS
jgi:orotidine-5'-phosphate decarboxylase